MLGWLLDRTMVDLAFKNLRQRKARSVLTVGGIAVAVALYITMSLLMQAFEEDLHRQAAGFTGKVVVQSVGDPRAGFPALSSAVRADEVERVLGQPGVDSARSTPVLFQELVSNPAPNMPPSVMAVGIMPGREEAFRGQARTEGSSTLRGPGDVILGAKAAAHYGKGVGDDLVIHGETFRVAGVMDRRNELVDSAVLMPLETAQRVFVRPGVVTAVIVAPADPSQVEPLAHQLAALSDRLTALTAGDIDRRTQAMLAAQRQFFAGVNGTVLSGALITITIVMVMAVAERRREVGTWKAIGAGRGTILMLVASEAVLLSLMGGLLAVPLSTLRVLFLSASPSVDVALVARTATLAVVIGAIAALWPAWNAERVDPLESLRYE